jgi:hypothetical protein
MLQSLQKNTIMQISREKWKIQVFILHIHEKMKKKFNKKIVLFNIYKKKNEERKESTFKK